MLWTDISRLATHITLDVYDVSLDFFSLAFRDVQCLSQCLILTRKHQRRNCMHDTLQTDDMLTCFVSVMCKCNRCVITQHDTRSRSYDFSLLQVQNL